MKCVYCKKPITADYICEDCMADIRTSAAVAEQRARTVACPACHNGVGIPCLTGSGAPRGIAHATRKALAERAA